VALQEASGLEEQLKFKEGDVNPLQSFLEEVKVQENAYISRCKLDKTINKIEEMKKRIEVNQLSAQEEQQRTSSEIERSSGSTDSIGG